MNQLNLFDDLYENEELVTDDAQDDIDDQNTDTKVCRICNTEKSIDDFFLDRGKLYSKCRECFKR